MSHRVELGEDLRGNLIRMDNALAKMPQRLADLERKLDNLYQQQAAAQAEVGKPFPYEQELAEKSARLIELDMQLNMNGNRPPQREDVVAKGRPSVLEQLKNLPSRTGAERKQKPILEAR